MLAHLPPDGHSLAIRWMYVATGWVLPATGQIYIATQQEVDRNKLVGQWLRHWAPNSQVVSLIPTATPIYFILFFIIFFVLKSITLRKFILPRRLYFNQIYSFWYFLAKFIPWYSLQKYYSKHFTGISYSVSSLPCYKMLFPKTLTVSHYGHGHHQSGEENTF